MIKKLLAFITFLVYGGLTLIEKFLKFIKELVSGRFYGKVVVSFENGKIVHLKKEESIKL